MAGHIMVALGNRLAFYRWDGTRLTPTGRLDTAAFLVTSALVLPASKKPLVLFGDVVKGMGLARYSHTSGNTWATDLLAHEAGETEVTAAGLVKLARLGLMASADVHGTLRLLEYQPSPQAKSVAFHPAYV